MKNSRIAVLLILLSFTPVSGLLAQNHFQTVWTGNPYLAMNIYVTQASIGPQTLTTGDEIGVFDGTLCVGAKKLSAPIPAGGYFSINASSDDPSTSQIDGFTPGHTIIYKLWKSSSSTEITSVTPTYSVGAGTFTSQGTVAVQLDAVVPGTVKVKFQVNMSVYINSNDFNVATDTVFLSGSINNWVASIPLADPNHDGIYETTLDLKPGSQHTYKYYMKSASNIGYGWEGYVGPGKPYGDRTFQVPQTDYVMPVEYFNNYQTARPTDNSIIVYDSPMYKRDVIVSPDGKKITFFESNISNFDGNRDCYIADISADHKASNLMLIPALNRTIWGNWGPVFRKPLGNEVYFFTDREYFWDIMKFNITTQIQEFAFRDPVSTLNNTIRFSPDGAKFVADHIVNEQHQIASYNVDGTGFKTILNVPWDVYPDWSPDGSKIVYTLRDSIFTISPDGTNNTFLFSTGFRLSYARWSPDGKKIACEYKGNIYTIDADGQNPTQITNTDEVAAQPEWDPSGNRIYYIGRRNSVYTHILSIPLPSQSIITITSPSGGENWIAGSAQNITWTSANVSNVKIEYTYNNGMNWIIVAEKLPASTGNYIWTVPGTPSTNCRVRISNADNPGLFSTSAALFTLAPVIGNDIVLTQQGNKLVGNDIAGAPLQGRSVHISADGNTAIVGGMDDNAGLGAAWVFTRFNGIWTQQGSKLVGTGSVGLPRMGRTVCLSDDGNTAAISGYEDNESQGVLWVFTRSNGVWSQQGTKLTGAGAVGSSLMGISADISADGNTIVVGGSNDNANAGAAWVFTRSNGIWTQQGPKLIASDLAGAAKFGVGVGISADGNTIVIGGYQDNLNQGAAWVFTRTNGTWSQQGSKLTGAGSAGPACQGRAVAISPDGNTIAVGGYYDNSHTGATWIFTRSNGAWTQQGPKLIGSGYEGSDIFQGTSVSLSGNGDVLMTGGYGDNSSQGAAWVFYRKNGNWIQQGNKLAGTGRVNPSVQGISVGLSTDGNTAIIGGEGDDSQKGASWIFTSNTTSEGSLILTGGSASANDSVVVTLKGKTLTNVGAITLKIEYDPQVLTYGRILNLNPKLMDALINAQNGIIYLAWGAVQGITLEDEKILDIKFLYKGSNSPTYVKFIQSECEIADANENTLSAAYTDGSVVLGNSISGKITYRNDYGTPMDNISAYLRNRSIVMDQIKTDISGNYKFNNISNASYTYKFDVAKPWAGVNSTDALRVLRYFVGVVSLDSLQKKAADVNFDGRINSTDALAILRRYVGLTTSFKIGDWVFEEPTLVVNGTSLVQNIRTLCAGDVNCSYVPPLGKSFSIMATTNRDKVNINDNKAFVLPVEINNNCSLGAFTLSLIYPEKMLEVKEVRAPKLEGFVYKAENGILKAAWTDILPVGFRPEEKLVEVTFNLKGAPNSESNLNIQIDGESEFADQEGNIIEGLSLNIPKLEISVPSEFKLSQNYPNPFNPSTAIEYDMPEDGRVSLEVFNLLGEKVATLVDEMKPAGSYKSEWNAMNQNSGIYIYRLNISGSKKHFSQIRKMMLIK